MKKVISVFLMVLLSLVVVFRVTSTSAVANSDSEINDIVAKTELETNDITVGNDAENKVSDEDIELLALLTMAEAESECEEGQRLVIDSVLNRVDNCHFPDSIRDVVYQPHQYASMWNGRAERCQVTEELVRLVKEELADRTNHDVVFFRTERYSDYGIPLFQVQNHYFSAYE